MRRAFIGSLCSLILAGATYCGAVAGCGGGGGDTPAPTARSVTGTIASSASANLASIAKAAVANDCSGITAVVAMASDGTTVTDDTLESCAFSLELTIGTAYLFEFRNPNKKSKSFANGLTIEASSAILYPSATQQFTALKDGVQTTDVTWKLVDGDVEGVLKTSAGSKFTIEDGSDEIPLGTITIANGSANFNSDVVCNNPGNAKYILCEDWTGTIPDELTGYGSVDANGLYTAPSALPSTNHALLFTSLNSDSSQTATADIFIAGELIFDNLINLTDSIGVSAGTDCVALSLYESSVHLYGVAADSTSGVELVKSDDGGATFTKSAVYSCATYLCAQMADITTDVNGYIYVAWSHGNASGPGSISSSDIYYSRSIDGGSTFSAPIKVNSGVGWNWDPCVRVDSNGNVYIVWSYVYSSQNDADVVFSKSTDAGLTFSNQVVLANAFSDYRRMTIDSSDRIYIAYWHGLIGSWQGNLYVIRSDDSGATFSSPIRANNVENSVYAVNWGLGIAVDNDGRVFVVWSDVRNYMPQSGDYVDLYAAASVDYGATFSDNIKVSQSHNYNNYPSISVDISGNPSVCWRQSNVPATTTGTMFSRSIDGISWTPEISVNTASTSVNNQACAISIDSSDKVYILFRTSAAPGSLYINTSD